MKKNKLKALLLAFCLVLPTMFILTACGHKHSYGDDWSTNETSHWHACTGEKCDETKDSAEHTFETKYDATNHWSECSVCGYKKGEEAHYITVAEINTTNHKLRCEDCGYLSGEIDHTYEEDNQTTCDGCSHERDQASLAFKSGTYDVTYDGNAYAFDKNNLVTVTHVDLSEVVVEYSVSGTSTPVWTTEAPKNAGTYNIRISVPATNDHTSAEKTKQFKINQIEIDLTNFSRVYSSEMANSERTEKVTSADISGILASDELQIRIVRNQAVSITEGTSYDLKWYTEAQEGATGDAFAVLGLGNSNYKLKSGTTGKIYITNSLTASEGSYSGQAAIQKGGYGYYSLKMNRTSKNINFDVTLSDSNAKIEKVYSKADWFTAKIAADGTLVTNGTVTGNGTIFIVVKYNGTEDSITNTLTLTQNTATTTVANTSSLTNALNTDNVDQYHTTLKENGTIIEENKVNKSNNKYYKNNNETEVYYEQYNSGVSFFKYANKAGKFVRELVFTDSESLDSSKSQAFNATKFSSELLSAFTDINQLTFTVADQMYHRDSFTIGTNTYTNIAFKFENSKLVYAKYELNSKTYTIELEYGDPNVVCPSYAGQYLNNPITATYVSKGDDAKKFMSTGTYVESTYLTYYEFEITDAVITAFSGTLNKCSLQGEFTADEEDVEFTIKVYESDGKTEVTNNKSTENGKLLLTNLTTGKYIISVSCNKACTLSLSMEQYEAPTLES